MSDAPSFLDQFDRLEESVRDVLVQLVAEEDLDAAARDAREIFAAMEGEIPYADQLGHVMYWSSFGVFQSLAIYKAAAQRGIDVHAVGRAILAAPLRVRARPLPADAPEKMREDALASQASAAPHEFVFEIVPGDADVDWGIDIKSCAVCHAFAKHDAMALVPYMCATDDKTSDAGEQGLRRTGTIALGADRCDFRFKAHGEPLRLAEQYPDAIRTQAD